MTAPLLVLGWGNPSRGDDAPHDTSNDTGNDTGVIGRSLQLAARRPAESFVFLVGEQPVVVCWGYEKEAAASLLPAVLPRPPMPAPKPAHVSVLADVIPADHRTPLPAVIPDAGIPWVRTLLAALEKGLHHQSLAGLHAVARACLVKTEARYDAFDRAFLRVFKGVEGALPIDDEVMRWLEEAKALPELTPEQWEALQRLSARELMDKFAETLAGSKETRFYRSRRNPHHLRDFRDPKVLNIVE